MPLPASATEQNIRSILSGNTVLIEGNPYGMADLEDRDKAIGYIGTDVLANAEAEARMMLAKELDETRTRLAELEAQAPEKGSGDTEKLHTLIGALMPTSKTAIEGKSRGDLALIADYKGIDTEGKDKSALVAEILSVLKPEGN